MIVALEMLDRKGRRVLKIKAQLFWSGSAVPSSVGVGVGGEDVGLAAGAVGVMQWLLQASVAVI
jgi:hypothetical protein